MLSRDRLLRYGWTAAILLATSATVAVLVDPGEPEDLDSQLLTRMRTTLEQLDPQQHQHGGHQAPVAAETKVVCGVRVYGHEPAGATAIADVRTLYGFHFCGVVEPKRPWDVADKLAGPVVLDLATDPPGVRVVEATEDTKFADRLREMFPPKYAELAAREALPEPEMADARRRYEAAAGL